MLYFLMLVVVCRLSGVDVDYRLVLSVIVVCLLVVACRLSSADFKLSGCICPWLLLVLGCWVSVFGCWLLIVAQFFFCRCPALFLTTAFYTVQNK
jgi:hypothetical protein